MTTWQYKLTPFIRRRKYFVSLILFLKVIADNFFTLKIPDPMVYGICLHACVCMCIDLMPYHIPWSIHCLSSSIGGCAPYFSLAGMFISSTKMTLFFPMGGPNTPFLRLSNLDIIKSWEQEKPASTFARKRKCLMQCVRGRDSCWSSGWSSWPAT